MVGILSRFLLGHWAFGALGLFSGGKLAVSFREDETLIHLQIHSTFIIPPCWPWDRCMCTPNVRVPMEFIVFSRLGIITHKYLLYRGYIGISHRGTLVGVHPTIHWMLWKPKFYPLIFLDKLHEATHHAETISPCVLHPNIDITSHLCKYMGVSKNSGTPKSSILIGFSIIFTIHFGIFPLFLVQHPYIKSQKMAQLLSRPRRFGSTNARQKTALDLGSASSRNRQKFWESGIRYNLDLPQ